MKQTAHTTHRPLLRRPLVQIVLSRLREFYREPEAVFWVYGFPLLMVVALGIAFRNQPDRPIAVDVVEGKAGAAAEAALAANQRFLVRVDTLEACRQRLRLGKTDLVVISEESAEPRYDYWFDPGRPESALARNAVDDCLQRAAGRQDPVPTGNREMTDPGGRYIDFLVPGLLGMSLMGGGLWGVGFVTVDMRIRKLLKRLLATPMRKSDFLAGIMASRLLFMVPEVLVLLVFARLAFGVENQGNLLSLIALIFLGAFSFAGIGLLVASRAKTLEAVSGLMNLVMLPMWVLSGIFFSPDRFPEMAQPFIRALPLTQLIDSLRGVMLEGTSLAAQGTNVAALAAWGGVSFLLALRLFRWS
ncbi:MAG TPA: ABC transporter permease [Pirellulales bacterium]|nr:ABC transporter permease [Pirellulales bacterium]